MFGYKANTRARQLFADQFQPGGDGFVYRRSLKGAPVPVSAAERERYIAVFGRFNRYGIWFMTGAMILFAVAITIYVLGTGKAVSQLDITIGVVIVMAVYLATYLWAWNLPVRELRGRGTVGEPLSRADVQRQIFARITYGQLLGGVAVAGLLIVRATSKGDPLSGWNLAQMIFAALIVALCAAQAWRKWRYESANK